MTLPLDSVVIQHGFINPYCRILNLLDPDPVMWRILTPLRPPPPGSILTISHPVPWRILHYLLPTHVWRTARLYCAARVWLRAYIARRYTTRV